MDKSFYKTEITDEIFARIKGKSYKDYCTLPLSELTYLQVLHWDFEGYTRMGELIVNAELADEVLEIFRELYEIRYPIEKIRLIDEYDADDEAAMADNNSSAFNYRTISFSNVMSNHSKGRAIDINPRYNPYVKMVDGKLSCEPANGEPYMDRNADFPYKITREDPCCQIFLKHGFAWGGDWDHAKDYQHFDKVEE